MAADSHITGSLSFMLDLFVYVSFFLFLIGLFPARYGRYPNDALLLKMLMRSAGVGGETPVGQVRPRHAETEWCGSIPCEQKVGRALRFGGSEPNRQIF